MDDPKHDNGMTYWRAVESDPIWLWVEILRLLAILFARRG